MSKPILNSLPELIAAGILSQETADRITAFYTQKEGQQAQRQSIAFALLGSVLVGLGIILLVAHNWDNLARPLKVFFSFLPLVAAQAICAYVLWKKREQRNWVEGAASLLFFAVGASIALVSQVYNIPGATKEFLFMWLLLTFPLLYIMQSSMLSLLYIAGLTVYGTMEGNAISATSYHYWWMLLLVLPHYVLLLRKFPESNFTLFHNWFIPFSLTICLGALAGRSGIYTVLAYVNMFSAFYLLGLSPYFQKESLRSNGYFAIGSIGTIVLLLITSFTGFWKGLDNNPSPAVPQILAIAISFAAAAYLLYKTITRSRRATLDVLGFVFIPFGLAFIVGLQAPLAAVIIINLLVLAVAISTMHRGLLLNHLGILNFGLLILAVLALCRFFDTDISFVLRALMFLVVGAGFFIANNMLLKKRRQHAQ